MFNLRGAFQKLFKAAVLLV